MHEIKKIKRHSMFVRWLKIILPSFAVVLGVIFVTRLVFSISIPLETQFGTFALYNGKLVMDNPKLTGLSKKGERYTIEARRAIQDIGDDSKWQMENISASFNAAENKFSLQTKTALYEIANEILIFENPISINVLPLHTSASRTSASHTSATIHNAKINFQQAEANLQTGEIKSQAQVEMIWQSGNLTANSFLATDSGKKYIFADSVKTIFYAKNPTGNSK